MLQEQYQKESMQAQEQTWTDNNYLRYWEKGRESNNLELSNV